jgi:hypothetical protein
MDWRACCFVDEVQRDHTDWCGSCFHGGKSREITLSGVLAVFMVGSPERSYLVVCYLFRRWSQMRSHCAICFAVGVWRDHTKCCASCFHVGKSREITPRGVLAVFMLGRPERSH